MDHTQLEHAATAIFGFTPDWSPRTKAAILAKCAKNAWSPLIYLRAFASEVKVEHAAWRNYACIMSDKWDQFIPDMLQYMKEEAKVRADLDALNIRSATRIEGSLEAALNNEIADITAYARVEYGRAYGLDAVVERWQDTAYMEQLRNPFLIEAFKA